MRYAAAALLAFALLLLAVPWASSPPASDRVVLEARPDSRPAAEPRFDRAPQTAAAPEAVEPVARPEVAAPEAKRVVVRAIDADGRPVAGLGVVRWRTQGGSPFTEGKLATNEQGECAFEIGAKVREQAERGARYSVAVDAPLGCYREQAFDPLDPPREPIVFVVERGGSFDISVVNELGEVHSEPVSIELGIVGDVSAAATHQVFADARKWSGTSGRSQSPPLALGCRWRISAEPVDQSHAQSHAVVDGPTRAGEVITVRISLGSLRPMLLARLLDAAKQPLIEQTVYSQLRWDEKEIEGKAARTDAEGRVHWTLPLETTNAQKLELWISTPANTPEWIAMRVLPAPLAGGAIDLGDIACAEIPIGVAGQVVDAAGAPLQGVGVHVPRRSPTTNGLSLPWVPRTITDADGRFAIRVPETVPKLMLTATQLGYRGVDLEDLPRAAPETLAMHIVLHRVGSIAGRALVDQPENATLWSIEAWKSGAEAPEQHTGLRFDGSSGSFEFGHLGTGLHSLRFGFHAATVAALKRESPFAIPYVYELRDLRVPDEGGACIDPRLDSIDLRGLLKRRLVRVLDSAGKAMTHQAFAFGMRAAEGGWVSYRVTTEHGVCVFLGPSQLEELHLGVQGYRIHTLDPSAADQTVRMQRGIDVAVEIAAGAPELSAGFEYWLQLCREDVPELWIAAFGDAAPAFQGPVRNGRAEIIVPAPGTYRVQWHVWRGIGSEEAHVAIESSTHEAIEIRDEAGVQTFRSTPPPDGMRAALRRFDRH